MSQKITWPALIVVLVSLLFLVSCTNSQEVVDTLTSNTNDTSKVDTPESEVKEEVLLEQGDVKYVTYSKEVLEKYQGKRPIILFFHAKWCPSCKALDSTLTQSFQELTGDAVLIKVDYDQELELKKKYGVTIQHTLVGLDTDGEKVNSWLATLTLAQVQEIIDALSPNS